VGTDYHTEVEAMDALRDVFLENEQLAIFPQLWNV